MFKLQKFYEQVNKWAAFLFLYRIKQCGLHQRIASVFCAVTND